MYLIHVFVEEESGQAKHSKNDLQRHKGKKKRNKDDHVNFLAGVNKINMLLD